MISMTTPKLIGVVMMRLRLAKLLRLAYFLVAAWLFVALTASTQGQPTVTLAWDSSPDSSVTGYRLYAGLATGSYSEVLDVGNATDATVSNLISGVAYFFAATAYNTNGEESDFSNEVSYTVPSPTDNPPALALTAPEDGAVYTGPVILNLTADLTPNDHSIAQVQFFSDLILLGVSTTAPYSFSWNDVGAGTYTLRAQVVYDSGRTVASAPVSVTVAEVSPPTGLAFAPYWGTTDLQPIGALTWDASSDMGLGGYRLYEGVASGVYANVIDAGNVTSVTVSNLVSRVTYFLPLRLTIRTVEKAVFPPRSAIQFSPQPTTRRRWCWPCRPTVRCMPRLPLSTSLPTSPPMGIPSS